MHDVVLPHAFIIVFDVNEVRSFEKAVTIARFIRDEPNNVLLTNNPIFFFANKTDATNSKEDIDRSWAHYQKQIKHLIETVKTDSKAITRINKGSIKLNQVHQDTTAITGSFWTFEEYIDDSVYIPLLTDIIDSITVCDDEMSMNQNGDVVEQSITSSKFIDDVDIEIAKTKVQIAQLELKMLELQRTKQQQKQ